MKRAQGLPITTIIIAALGIIVLVVIGAIFGGQIGKFGRAASECPGRCYKLNPPADAAGLGIYSDQPCDKDFETKLSGGSIPRGMPKADNPGAWRCDECCILAG
jgi:hypothetical protein